MEILVAVIACILSFVCVSFALYNSYQSKKIMKEILKSYENQDMWRWK